MNYKHIPLPAKALLWLRQERLFSEETIKRAEMLYAVADNGKGYISFVHTREGDNVLSRKMRAAPGFKILKHEKWKFDPGKISQVFGKDHWPEPEPRSLYFCEGELDCLLLNQYGFAALTSSTGAASTNHCLDHLPKGIGELVLLLDNDKTGRDQTAKVAREARKRWPQLRIRTIKWPEEMKKGADVTDFALQCHGQSDDFVPSLAARIHDVDEALLAEPEQGWTETPSSPLLPITEPVDLESVLQRTRSIGFSHDWQIEVLLATFVSKEVDKKRPLWLLIVGAPSSNKTVGIGLLRDPMKKESYGLDVMTSNPFVSGMSKKDNPQDLLPHLAGKCFLMKDYTAFFGRSEETVKQLLSDMVAIYDGEYSKHSGARGTISYTVSFSHIGAITPLGLQKRQQYMNMIGPRFLIMRLPALSDEEREEGFDIAWSDDLDKNFGEAHRYALHFATLLCQSIRENGVQLAPASKEIKQKINLLAKLISHTRGIVQTSTQKFETDTGEEKSYQEVEEIQKEEPFRALHQLKVLCRCLAIIRGKEAITDDEVKTARLVALSSMPVHRAEALSVFQTYDRVTAKQTADVLHQNYKTAKRHLDELVNLEVLMREKEVLGYAAPVDLSSAKSEEGKDGKAWVYSPHPRFAELLTMEDSSHALPF